MKAVTKRIEHKVEIFDSKNETQHPKIVQLDNGEFMLIGSYGFEYISNGKFLVEELEIENPRLKVLDKITFERYFEVIEDEKGGDFKMDDKIDEVQDDPILDDEEDENEDETETEEKD